MDLTIFDLKPIFTKSDGTNIRDLTYPSIRFTYDCSLSGVVPISDYMQMRPDLLSRSAYGSNDQWDLVLKYNGYSNPFSICNTDTFLIPDLTDMSDQLAPDGSPDTMTDSIRQQYIDASKKAQTDPKLAAAEQLRKNAQKQQAANSGGIPSISNLPPNIAENGDQEIVIQGGKVYFGPNISKGKQQCEQPLTKSEFVANLIKNRLQNS